MQWRLPSKGFTVRVGDVHQAQHLQDSLWMTLERASQLVTSPVYWPCNRKWTRNPNLVKSVSSLSAPWCHSSRLQQKQLLCPDSGSHSIMDESHPQSVSLCWLHWEPQTAGSDTGIHSTDVHTQTCGSPALGQLQVRSKALSLPPNSSMPRAAWRRSLKLSSRKGATGTRLQLCAKSCTAAFPSSLLLLAPRWDKQRSWCSGSFLTGRQPSEVESVPSLEKQKGLLNYTKGFF